ncbi:hypothetical protein [Chryseobacterium hispalense]|uniref:hypothetical protein n=1 Tax=Chryseobacterium hispalense TaxID=1453492 RepID=UPI000493597D|nr:hypothetical protein [Chryseobacterium hispalense]
MKNNMLNKLKSDYEELEIKPSSELWNRLDDKLDQNPESALEKKFQWWQYAAVMLLLVSMGTVLYFNTQKKAFNYKETDYIVKKGLEKTVDPINPEFQNQKTTQNQESLPFKPTENRVASKYQQKIIDSSLHTKKEKVLKPEVPEVEIQSIAAGQAEKIDIAPAKIESHTPIIVQAKTAKPTYINSNELLLGREFDKARENSQKNDIKIGIFNFEKPRPKVENVTVLGVTVYVDPK